MAEQYQHESDRRFSSPEEELTFLRAQVKLHEEALARGEGGGGERAGGKQYETRPVLETLARYRATPVEMALAPGYRLPEPEGHALALNLAPEAHDAQIGKLLELASTRGIRNVLSVAARMGNLHLEDDLHRALVEYVLEGHPMKGGLMSGALTRALHMTLYEVLLPEERDERDRQKSLKELISSMEQFYAGMLSIEGGKGSSGYFTIEIALPHIGEEISFFVAVPTDRAALFEKQMLAVFPRARIDARPDDYNIFNAEGASVGAVAGLVRHPVLPLRLYETFDYDPLNVIANAFSKIERVGEGAALQLVFRPVGEEYLRSYRKVAEKLAGGEKLASAVQAATGGLADEAFKFARELFGSKKPTKDESPGPRQVDEHALALVRGKIATPIVAANLRLLASAATESRALSILDELIASFNQFEDTHGNSLKFYRHTGKAVKKLARMFSFRAYASESLLPLSLRELTTIFHFPPQGITAAPRVRQSSAESGAAPLDLSSEGVILGKNVYRGATTEVRMGSEDRLRHLYVIGQTGTGKSTLLKNMIIQDIVAGEGVAMLDPHGSDILDVLASVPPERFADVIYFDPSSAGRPMALNMLEYDQRFPEQKTFVVNELFSIFKKLYGAVPESMGPAFEQYFRNATMLVIEDPETGSTLLDVSRVLANKTYRDIKLARCRNPIVVQFWREVAEKAGGEASLSNMVPYITNKFDVFLSNEIMRPIIAQEHSSFNFREIMDSKKILLVNLSKGRLGDINAHLIGLILVGKILMAALSRADAPGQSLPNFYLYLDEFQNITTDSIATILSEARKYRLGLTVAHQFIAQLDERIRDAVFGNVGSIAAFRVGAEDAEVLEKQFAPAFHARDIMNVENRHAYVKLLVHGRPTRAFDMETMPPPPGNHGQIDTLRELSYRTFGRDRHEIEAEIAARYK
jgi:hypothetical protein